MTERVDALLEGARVATAPVLAPIIASTDPTRRIGWAITRQDALTMQQREYMRRLRVWERARRAARR